MSAAYRQTQTGPATTRMVPGPAHLREQADMTQPNDRIHAIDDAGVMSRLNEGDLIRIRTVDQPDGVTYRVGDIHRTADGCTNLELTLHTLGPVLSAPTLATPTTQLRRQLVDHIRPHFTRHRRRTLAATALLGLLLGLGLGYAPITVDPPGPAATAQCGAPFTPARTAYAGSITNTLAAADACRTSLATRRALAVIVLFVAAALTVAAAATRRDPDGRVDAP